MRIKYIFITLVVNIFALCVVTLYQEYADIKNTFKSLDSNFDLAVDAAIINSTASEEFFSDAYDDAIASKAKDGVTAEDISASMHYMRNGSWVRGNSYIISMYNAEKGHLPTQSEYNNYASNIDTTDIYEFLFGSVGSDYDSSSLSWANFDQGTYVINANRRQPTPEFKAFYDAVGKDIISTQFVKARDMSDPTTWTMVEKDLPVLAQMGLKLDTYNEVTSMYTADNFTTVEHYGKLIPNGVVALGNPYKESIYFLTPYSLGVTYLPPSVLKTNLRVNLENLIRLSKCKLSPTRFTYNDMNAVYTSAEGCIDTSVYDDGAGGASVDSIDHRVGATSEIFNDGNVEYDMSTLQVKVDYFPVDFYNDANWQIVNEIEGATPYDSTLLNTLPSRLKDTDTLSGGSTNSGMRLVAKVTAKVKVNIPYKSPILQWFVNRTSTNSEEHFGVARWNESTGQIEETADGLWYTYTTYTAVKR